HSAAVWLRQSEKGQSIVAEECKRRLSFKLGGRNASLGNWDLQRHRAQEDRRIP
ncbi:hypothetical protein BaRGS_00000977, partial [Batillaria attramentaria]